MEEIEKEAKRLIELFREPIDWNTVAMPNIKTDVAKQCALICIDEKLDSILEFNDDKVFKKRFIFLTKVKQYILDNY